MEFAIGLILALLSVAGITFLALLALKREVEGELTLRLSPGEVHFARLYALARFVSWFSAHVTVTVLSEGLSEEEEALLAYFADRYGWTLARRGGRHCEMHPNMLQ